MVLLPATGWLLQVSPPAPSTEDDRALLFCLLAVATVVLGAISIVALIRKTAPGGRLFDGPRQVLEAWREATSKGEKVLVLLMLAGQLFRPGVWSVLLAFVTTMGATVAAMCGWELPEVIAQFRLLIHDIYRLSRGEAQGT